MVEFSALEKDRKAKSAPSDAATTAVLEDERRVKELVSRLAISEEPAAMTPIDQPTNDTPKTDPRVIAYDAAKELRAFGTKAFPALLAALDDHRQSIPFRAIVPHDVGLACSCIIS